MLTPVLNAPRKLSPWRKRCKESAQVLGARQVEVDDSTIPGRLKIIARLKKARKTECERGKAGSWLYDVNRHLNICALLQKEYNALEEHLWKTHEKNADGATF